MTGIARKKISDSCVDVAQNTLKYKSKYWLPYRRYEFKEYDFANNGQRMHQSFYLFLFSIDFTVISLYRTVLEPYQVRYNCNDVKIKQC